MKCRSKREISTSRPPGTRVYCRSSTTGQQVSLLIAFGWPATSLASHDLPIEMRMTDHALEQSHPERHHHFRAAGGSDVANVDDVVHFPTKPFVQIFGYVLLRCGIVAADE